MPQRARVVGGFTHRQFVERRLPTLDELNALAPDTPDPPGGEIQRDGQGNPPGLLLAMPNAMILYATLAKGTKARAHGRALADALDAAGRAAFWGAMGCACWAF